MGSDFNLIQTPDFGRLAALKKENESFLLGSTGFRFLDDHFGFRPGCVHVLQGHRSGGKTSLARTLLYRICQENKVLWYSSEENQDQWIVKFTDDRQPNTENLGFISEADLTKLSQNEWFDTLKMKIKSHQAKIVVFDNLTTSRFYNDKKPDEQNKIIQDIKTFLREEKVSLFAVVHDNNDDGRSALTSSKVRGSKNLPNIVEYWYNLIRLRLDPVDAGGENVNVSLLHVEKCRAHDTSDTAYQLNFNRETKRFDFDKRISWTVAKDFFGKQINIKGK